MRKHVSVVASFAYGFRETWRHGAKVLPLSLLFFAPELAQAFLGLSVPRWASEAYKATVFFGLIYLVLRLTGKAFSLGERRQMPADYLAAQAIKYGSMALGFLIGLLPALAWRHHSAGTWPSFDWQGLMEFKAWALARPRWELVVILPALLFPYLFFVAWNFFGYAIMDKGLGAMESLRYAALVSKGVFWPLSLFYAVCGAFHVLGFYAWTVGVVFTFPVTLLATVYVYRELSSQTPLPVRSNSGHRQDGRG